MAKSRRRDNGLNLDGTPDEHWLLEAVPDLVALIDAEGLVLSANRLLAERMGLKLEELVGSNLYAHFDPEAAERRRAVAREVLAEDRPVEYEDHTSSGTILSTLVKPVASPVGEPRRLAVIATDVTERKRWETRVNRLVTALEQAAEGVVIMNANFIIEYVNQTFEQMTGYAQVEVKGRPIELLYRGTEQAATLADIRAEVAQGEIWVGRVVNTAKDGRPVLNEKTVTPIRGRGGAILGYVSMWRDVSRVIELERQLMQAQKMEAIGTLAAGIAHDFNNILGPVILHSELGLELFAEHQGPHPIKECFLRILRAGERGAALAEQILNLSRRRSQDQPVPFSLGSVVRECLKLLRPGARAGIDIQYSNEAESDMILADPAQVHQVIMNLCTNAVQAMEETGGRLSIHLGGREVRERDGGPREFVALTVADTGHGIPVEILDRIFDPFFTTRAPEQGTGLGLAVTRNILDRMGGSIRAENRPGGGASFEALLPLAGELGVDVDDLPGEGPSPHGSERVLVVDDDPSLLATIQSALNRLGYRVAACRDAQEALLTFSGQDFDLVMSNINMPGLSGLDLSRRLKARKPELPVLLFSGQRRLSPEELRAVGALEFLAKPFHMRELARCLRRILDNPGRVGK